MPSYFEREFARQNAAAGSGPYAVNGVAATYQPPTGAAVTTGLDGSPLMVIVDRNDPTVDVRESRGGSGQVQSAEILVRVSQLAKPLPDGRFTVEGVEVWTIETSYVANGQHNCTCKRTGSDRIMERRVKVNG